LALNNLKNLILASTIESGGASASVTRIDSLIRSFARSLLQPLVRQATAASLPSLACSPPSKYIPSASSE